VPPPVRERDLRGTGWWLLEQITAKAELNERTAAVGASLLRVLSALGPEQASEEEALAEIELRGRIMHGQPPRAPAEWDRATRTFDRDAIAEFQRWELTDLLLERDGLREEDPLVRGQAANDDVEMAVRERDEHRR
jgi:hypothetical protein